MHIETPRLLVRELAEDDAEPLASLWSDARVTEFMGGPRDYGEMLSDFRKRAIIGPESEYELHPVIERETSKCIGHCGVLLKVVDDREEVELIYVFASTHWGNGFATEAAIAIRDYAWDDLGLQRLICLVDPQHAASARVAEKIGMHFEHATLRPSGKTLHIYAMTYPPASNGA